MKPLTGGYDMSSREMCIKLNLFLYYLIEICAFLCCSIFPVCLFYGHFVSCTNPWFCLSHVEAYPAQAPALCGDDLGWVNVSWQKTPGWPSQHTCRLSLRCALSYCWMMLMTPMTHCSHSVICSKR